MIPYTRAAGALTMASARTLNEGVITESLYLGASVPLPSTIAQGTSLSVNVRSPEVHDHADRRQRGEHLKEARSRDACQSFVRPRGVAVAVPVIGRVADLREQRGVERPAHQLLANPQIQTLVHRRAQSVADRVQFVGVARASEKSRQRHPASVRE